MRRIKKFSLPLLVGGGTIVALEVARRLFRITQLFRPTRDPVATWNPEDYGIRREQAEEVWIETDDGELLYGWHLRANNPIASALYCHGNTGNLTNPAHLMPRLLECGINVLLFDYRGYGKSSGRATVRGVVTDTVAAAKYHDAIRPRNVPSLLFGFSLGGAIAAQVAQQYPFDGLILQSTFSTLPDVTRVAFPRVPLHLVSGWAFDTVRALKTLRIPVLILHGTNDEACPCWMADAMFDACGSASKEIYRIEGGQHKDLWDRDGAAMAAVVNRFALGHF
ncbi:MAG TPA: alpha/beta fold hydrolase [Thermoanaerobaculia bacterium]|nr:alpha/beta fold hydrolase [Thermoanaerobaculia bacterium]